MLGVVGTCWAFRVTPGGTVWVYKPSPSVVSGAENCFELLIINGFTQVAQRLQQLHLIKTAMITPQVEFFPYTFIQILILKTNSLFKYWLSLFSPEA